MKYAVCGIGALLLFVAIIGQIRSGATFPIARFRATEPRAFWAIVGVYSLALLAVCTLLLAWR
jgi:hypothetical protein